MATPVVTETTRAITFATSANKGLGLEPSHQLASLPHNYYVLITCRDPSRGQTAASSLQTEGLSVEQVVLDVTDDESISAAAESIREKYGHIGVLVNNAGILIEHQKDRPPRKAWKDTFDTNLFGVVAVTEAFIPLLRKSEQVPRIAFLGSDLGRLETKYDSTHKCYTQGPIPAFRCSKMVLEMLTLHYATQFREGWDKREDGTAGGIKWKINITFPGPTRADHNTIERCRRWILGREKLSVWPLWERMVRRELWAESMEFCLSGFGMVRC